MRPGLCPDTFMNNNAKGVVMSAYFEIAYAAASSRLCLFTGTGFSKALTENKAPGWQDLLISVCDGVKGGDALVEALFSDDGKNQLSLEEAAQVIDIRLKAVGKAGIHEAIAEKISELKLSGEFGEVEAFVKKNTLRVITTNYDTLFEKLAGDTCQSIAPGFPVPRASASTKVYHVHGSIASPLHMVVTADDYFRFMQGESYFSRKLSTALHENTVVILGYSLSDTNLKSIISDYKAFSRAHITGGNLFFVSRNSVDPNIKSYYAHCYGIRVLDRIEINAFFKRVSAQIPAASKYSGTGTASLKRVIEGNSYKDTYLKLDVSFYEINAAVGGLGKSINDPQIVAVLDKIIEKKIGFTREDGAWEQYDHLADWLTYLAMTLELKDTTIEKTFLEAVHHSMNKMSKNYVFGYSWAAYKTWSSRWADLQQPNRELIRSYIKKKCYDLDALEIVGRI